jgi:phenylalanyl-tRNA synthetase beta subunit
MDIMLLAELHAQQQTSLTYKTLQDQLIRKDISFVLPREGNYGQISDALLTVEEIAEVKLLDLYAGSSLADDEKSISLSFLIQGDGSVTTEQISTIMQKAIDAGQRAGGKLR